MFVPVFKIGYSIKTFKSLLKMRIIVLLLVVAVAFASCTSTRYGCPGVTKADTYKARKAKWG